MTGQPSEKVRPGDPLRIRAQTFNDVIDSKNDYIGRRQLGSPKEVRHFPISTDKIKVSNDSGADRRLGEVLEVDNEILIDIVDPEHLWQSGVSPDETRPFGILRKDTPSEVIDELQVSGVCKALVNIVNTDHKFAKVVAGDHVLESASSGPVQILYHPGTTGEQECIVLFIGATKSVIAEAIATTDSCPTDLGGSGSGSEGQEVEVEDFRLMPDCTLVDPPPKVTNPRNHRWPLGSLLTMTLKKCANGEEEWRVIDVELRPVCAVVGIEDRESCLVAAGLKMGVEYCPADEPNRACKIVEYDECGSGSGDPCDQEWDFSPFFACCGVESGSG